MDRPFFSIVLPTYNRAHFLKKAIDSVLHQTFVNWELIIVDDGSIDGTSVLISTYTDLRIRYHYQENQERSAARNNGIAIAKGTYICFLDSDDYFLENHLQNFYNKIISIGNPIAFLYCNVKFEFENGTFHDLVYEYEFEGNLDFILRTTIHSQQTCIHQSIFKKYSYNITFRIGEDIELWMWIFNEYPVIHVPFHSVVVVHHGERSVEIKNTESYRSIIPLYKHIFKKPNPGNKIPVRKKLYLYSALYFGISRSYIINKKKWNAIYYLSKSLLLSPFVIESKHRLYLIVKLLFTRNYCSYYCKHEIVTI